MLDSHELWGKGHGWLSVVLCICAFICLIYTDKSLFLLLFLLLSFPFRVL